MKFPSMSKYLQAVKSEHFEIRIRSLTKSTLQNMQFRDIINGRRESIYQELGSIVQLLNESGEVMMADTEMERRTNRPFLRNANGDVLIAGLGLGMIIMAIQDNDNIDSITIIEIEQEIIDLVAVQLPLNDKVIIIRDDILTWKPQNGIKFDTIYFDIWNTVCGDNYEDMKLLNRRFGRRLNRDNSNCWMSSWRYDEVKALELKSRQEIRRYRTFEAYYKSRAIES